MTWVAREGPIANMGRNFVGSPLGLAFVEHAESDPTVQGNACVSLALRGIGIMLGTDRRLQKKTKGSTSLRISMALALKTIRNYLKPRVTNVRFVKLIRLGILTTSILLEKFVASYVNRVTNL